jgi:hypothetical protein
MKGATLITMVLVVVPALAANDPAWSGPNFSIASLDGISVFGAGPVAGLSFPLVQPGRQTHAGWGYGDGTEAGPKSQFGPVPLAAPGHYGLQSMLTPMTTKASGSTLLIIGVALAAGGGVLFAATENGSGRVLGMILVGVGGFTIYKGIEVLISSSRGKHDLGSRGGLQMALRVSF